MSFATNFLRLVEKKFQSGTFSQMPMPQEYQNASPEFEKFLVQVRDELGLETRNQTYTTVQSVLIVFRRRLRPEQVLKFADVLPAVIRAIFVKGWSKDEFEPRFGSLEELTQEVKSFRGNHNFSPDDSISAVTFIIRSRVDETQFDKILDSISKEAQSYWAQ